MIVNTSVPRERLAYAAANGQPHLRSTITTVRDHGVSLCLMPQGKSPFEPMHDRPAIVPIGDDMLEAKGPNAFHRRSLHRYVKRCWAAAIVSGEPLPMSYAYVATVAARTRQNVILIEIRPEHEADWKAALDAANPDLSLLIATVQPMGGVQ
jgi:hypothetical protein